MNLGMLSHSVDQYRREVASIFSDTLQLVIQEGTGRPRLRGSANEMEDKRYVWF
jgi:hypothetical protein